MKNEMEYLIIGASGYIGKHLYDYLKASGRTVLGTRLYGKDNDLINFDLLDIKKVNNSLMQVIDKSVKSKTAIICSAMSKIDDCFCYAEKSYEINVKATILLIDILSKYNYKIIFLSTDNVFSGEKGFYKESDLKNPVNVYGTTKMLVEDYLINNFDNYVILRLSKVIGQQLSNKNLLYEIYNNAKAGKTISCIEENVISLVDIDDVVLCIEKIIEKNLKGIFNISNGEFFTRMELVNNILRFMNLTTKVEEKKIEEFNFKDKRPLKINMDNSYIKEKINIKFRTIDEICNLFMKNF